MARDALTLADVREPTLTIVCDRAGGAGVIAVETTQREADRPLSEQALQPSA